MEIDKEIGKVETSISNVNILGITNGFDRTSLGCNWTSCLHVRNLNTVRTALVYLSRHRSPRQQDEFTSLFKEARKWCLVDGILALEGVLWKHLRFYNNQRILCASCKLLPSAHDGDQTQGLMKNNHNS